jgi:Mrp family chromosome partitioning ATPase
LNLQDYIGAIWRRRLLVAALMALGVAAVQLVGRTGPPSARYTATVTLTVTEDIEPGDVLLYQQIVNDTSEISERVADDLGEEGVFPDRPTVAALEERVSVEANPEIGVMVMTAKDMVSEDAARGIIQSYTSHLLEFSGERRIAHRDALLEENLLRFEELRERIKTLEGELKSLAAIQSEAERAAGLAADQVRQTEYEVAVEQLRDVQTQIEELENQSDDELISIDQVSEPTITEIGSTDRLGPGGRIAVAVALAAVLGIGLAVMLHRFDNRVFRRKDVEAAFRLPVLAQVPHIGRLARRNHPIVVRSRPDHPAAEAYRLLRSGLGLARNRQLEQLEQLGRVVDRGGTAILVVSASGRVGRTTTAANLAAAAVAAGKRVLVVGADLRGGTVGSLFGTEPDTPGLGDAVAATSAGRRVALDDYTVSTAVPDVDLLPTGRLRSNPGETLAAARFLIQDGRRRYDMIIIDTPPMLVGNDVSELVPVSDLVLVVARAGLTTFDEGQWVDETAERLQAATCGVVLIGARSDLQRSGLANRFRRLLANRRRPRPIHAPDPGEPAPVPSTPVTVAGVAQVAEGAVGTEPAPPSAGAGPAGGVESDLPETEDALVEGPPPAVTGDPPAGSSAGSPPTSDEREDEEEPVVVVRVATGRSAGPASSMCDD